MWRHKRMYRSLHMYVWRVNYCWSCMYVCGPDCVYVFLFSFPCHTTDATSFPIFLHNSTTGWLWIQAKLCIYSVSASVASLMSRLDQHALSGKNSLCLKMTLCGYDTKRALCKSLVWRDLCFIRFPAASRYLPQVSISSGVWTICSSWDAPLNTC